VHDTNDIHVLGIVGSPRRNSNTEILVDEVLSGAAEMGAQIGKVILDELNIQPCKACDRCRDSQSCVQEDDMAPLLELMNQSQVWVLGTPIYWWGPTAQMKAFIDRWYGARHSRFQKRNVILTLPLGGGSERYAQPTIDMFKSIMNYLNMNHFATIVAPGVYHRGVVSEKIRILETAHQTGIDVVESLTIDEYDSVLRGLTFNSSSGSTVSDSE
jgi:multimeric flavodoxin WrbA